MESRFKVVYTGELQPYVSAQEAIQSISVLFKLPEDSVRAMVLGGRARDIKVDLDRATAERYVSALSKAGLSVRFEPTNIPRPELRLTPISAHEAPAASRDAADQCPKCGSDDVHAGVCKACGEVLADNQLLRAWIDARLPPTPPPVEPRANPYAPPKAELVAKITAPRAEALNGPRAVPIGHGWTWISGGFRHFAANPWIWILIMVVYGVIAVVASMIPIVGPVAPYLLAPVFTGGLMLGAQDQDRGEPLTFQHLFAGFATQTGQLFAAGALYLGFIVLATLPIVLAVGIPMFSSIMGWSSDMPGPHAPLHLDAPDQVVNPSVVLLAGLVTTLLIFPAIMAYWFAPALIAINGMSAWAAMKLSLQGCMKNVLPFLIYGLAAMVLLMAGAVPMLIGLLIVVPTLTASIYVAYRDIFYGRAQEGGGSA